MEFLITGSTGFIGRKLVSTLLREGHSVRTLSRSLDKVNRLFGNAVKGWLWDSKESPPPKAFEGVDSVIHLAGEGIADKRWSSDRKNILYDSRIHGTRAIVSVMERSHPRPQSFVCASAIGFYGDRANESLNEDSGRGTDFLSDVCFDWEKEALKVSVRTVVLRTGIVLGKDGGALKKLLPLFKLGLGGPVGNGRQWMSWIHVDDLIRLYIEAATNPAYQGPVNGVAPNPVTNAQFAAHLGHALHRPAFFPTPAFALKLALGELSVLVLSSQRVLPAAAEKAGFAFEFSMIRTALEDIVKKNDGDR